MRELLLKKELSKDEMANLDSYFFNERIDELMFFENQTIIQGFEWQS